LKINPKNKSQKPIPKSPRDSREKYFKKNPQKSIPIKSQDPEDLKEK
jgi:hypothetical protein